MFRRLLVAASAAALSLALAAPVVAQDLAMRQLQDSALTSFAQLGLDTAAIDRLTMEELTQVQAVTSSGDNDQTKIQRIETILRDAEARIAAGGSDAEAPAN
jgi:hypothetical protein